MAKTNFTIEKIIIIFTVVSAALLQMIDTSIVNVSLVQIMGNLGATLTDVGWVVTSYAAANVIMIALSGWLGAHFGRKNYFAASIIVFTISSIFCGASTNIWELVAFRFIQGLGGGGILTTAQAILVETFPGEELGFATAIYGLGVILGPTIGPVLGGYITDHLSWHWIFFVNIPFGILASYMTLTFVKEPEEKMVTNRMDWFGLACLVAGIGALQVVLERGEQDDWFSAHYIVVLTIVAVVGLVGFIWRELVVEHPLVDLRVFKIRTFAVGTFFNFILGFGLYASVFVLPVFAENLLGYTALQTGLLMLPAALLNSVMMLLIGNMLKRRVSPILLAGLGFFIFFIFSYIMSRLTMASSEMDLTLKLLIRSVGLGMVFIPLTTLSLIDLRGKDIPQGTGLSNMGRQLGGSIGIALVTSFIDVRYAFHYSVLRSDVSAYNMPTQMRLKMYVGGMMAKGSSYADALHKSYTFLHGNVAQQSILLSYRDVFLAVGVLFVVCIPLLLLFRNKKGTPQGEVKVDFAME